RPAPRTGTKTARSAGGLTAPAAGPPAPRHARALPAPAFDLRLPGRLPGRHGRGGGDPAPRGDDPPPGRRLCRGRAPPRLRGDPGRRPGRDRWRQPRLLDRAARRPAAPPALRPPVPPGRPPAGEGGGLLRAPRGEDRLLRPLRRRPAHPV